MAEYKEEFEIMSKKIYDFFHSAETEENNDPFTYNVIDAFESIFTASITKMKEYISEIEIARNTYMESFSRLSSDYKKKEKLLEMKLKEDEEKIQEKYKEKSEILDKDIKVKEDEISFDEKNKLQDIEFFVIASEQNQDLFQREYDDNVNRFNYQIQVAKESYSQNTIHYNDILTKELEELKNEYENVVGSYDEETEALIRNYTKKKISMNQQLDEKNRKIEMLQENSRALKRKESMELNDQIRALMDKKNERIQEAKSLYAQRQADSNEEKENKRQQFQVETQKINKDFLINMTALEEKLSKTRDEYNSNVDTEKRELQYHLYELKCEQEKELLALYKNNASKAQIKRKKAEYYHYYETEKKNTAKTIKNLTRGYSSETENIAYQKKLADLDRSLNIKSILEQDSNNTKIFQEVNNEYESEMNQTIETANLEFNREAHLLRTRNTISTLQDEKNFDESDANFEKEIEALLTDIKNMDYEIQSFQEIRGLIHKYEDTKYEVTKNFKTVYTVLEIEKCKVLDILNHSMYNLNKESSQMVLDSSREAEMLKNKEYEVKTKNQIERNKLVLGGEKMLVEYQKHCYNQDMETELLTLKRNYYFELDTLGHAFLSSKFPYEYKLVNQHISVLSRIQTEIRNMNIRIINYLFNTVAPRPEHFRNVRTFCKGYLLLSFEIFERLMTCFHTFLNEFIDERFTFEKAIQYKGYYKNLESEYKNDIAKLEYEKKRVFGEIEHLTGIIENNKNLLFSMDNDLSQKKRKLRDNQMPAIILKEEIEKLLKDQETLHTDNIRYEKKIISLNKEMMDYESQIESLNLSYSRSQDEIKKMQETNAKSYSEMKLEMDKFILSSLMDIKAAFRIPETPGTDIAFYQENLKIATMDEINKSVLLLKGLYQITERFSENEKESILKSTHILDAGYRADLAEIEEDQKKARSQAQQMFLKEEQARARGITEFDRNAAQSIINLHNQVINHNNSVKEKNASFEKAMEDANQAFYNDYYAICDNQKDMVLKQKSDITKLTNEYENNRKMVIARFQKNREDLNQAFKEYIQNKDDIIKRLPEAQKNQEYSIHTEASKKSMEMDQSFTDIKYKYQSEKREIQKNRSLIEAAFRAKQDEFVHENRINKQKEKKAHLSQLKHISAK